MGNKLWYKKILALVVIFVFVTKTAFSNDVEIVLAETYSKKSKEGDRNNLTLDNPPFEPLASSREEYNISRQIAFRDILTTGSDRIAGRVNAIGNTTIGAYRNIAAVGEAINDVAQKFYCKVSGWFGSSCKIEKVTLPAPVVVEKKPVINVVNNISKPTTVVGTTPVTKQTVVVNGITLAELEARLALFRSTLNTTGGSSSNRDSGGSRISVDRIYDSIGESSNEAAENAVTGGNFSFNGINGTFSGNVSVAGSVTTGTLNVSGTTTQNGALNITGPLLADGDVGTGGYVLQSTGNGVEWVSTTTLGIVGGGAGPSSWGAITGTLSSQTDLQNALNAKQNSFATGTSAQYLKGNLTLGTFPTTTSAFTNDSGFITDLDNLTYIEVGNGNESLSSTFGASAMGYQNCACGQNSSALGIYNQAMGLADTAVGNNNLACGNTSVAVGYYNNACGSRSAAFGVSNTATACRSVAFGNIVRADACLASAFGTCITNSTAQSTMIGPSQGNTIHILNTGEVKVPYLTATSTTATSTLTNACITGALSVGGTAGTNGYVLQTTGTGVQWVATSTLGFVSGTPWTSMGYLTSYTETDPIYGASSWSTTTNNSANWNTAFGWGNHATAGYLSTSTAASTYVPQARTINGLALSANQTFATSSTGTDFGITSAGTVHTFNLPTASGTNRGLLSSADWTTFNNKGSGTVTGITVASANGFTGTSSGGATPALTLGTSITGILKGNGTAISAASAGSDYEVPLTFSTGLVRTGNTVTASTTQNIAALSNLTTNGFVTTCGSNGTLGVDTTAYTPTARTINGLDLSSDQTFATSSTGTDFGITSAGTVHTFNLPDASTSTRGVITTGAQSFSGAKTFAATTTVANACITGALSVGGTAGTNGYVLQTTGTGVQWVATSTLGLGGGSSIFSIDVYETLKSCNSLNTTNTGCENNFIGSSSGKYNTSGYQNVFVGTQSGYGNQDGHYNTFSGFYSGRNNLSGDFNVAVGTFAGRNNVYGNYNTSVGVGSGSAYGWTGLECTTAIGVGSVVSANCTSAVGYCNTASGHGSSAFGYVNIVSEMRASAFGYNNCASGTFSSASGHSNSATGFGSSALGYENNASGYYASSLGSNNTSSGLYSSASGHMNTASGYYGFSSAFGYRNYATNDNSSALGYMNCASGCYSTAVGLASCATGKDSVAIGNLNVASNCNSLAFGRCNTSAGSGGSGFGFLNVSSGGCSSAFGNRNTASGCAASVFGYCNTGSTLNSVAVGRSNFTGTGLASVSFGILNNQTGGTLNTTTGAITGTPAAVNSGCLSAAVGISNCATGNLSSAFGYNNKATATSSSALGSNITNSTTDSVMIGPSQGNTIHILNTGEVKVPYLTATSTTATSTLTNACITGALSIGGTAGTNGYILQTTGTGVQWVATSTLGIGGGLTNNASGYCSTALGCGGTDAPGYYSTALGYGNTASGCYSLAIGYQACSLNHQSIAFGYRNVASHIYSSAVGSCSCASGAYSSAFGYYNTASSHNSSAFGYSNNACGSCSSAFGYSNCACGSYSSALGNGSASAGDWSSAFGYSNYACGGTSLAVGYQNCATVNGSNALGASNTASGYFSSAVGYGNINSGHSSSAFGYCNYICSNFSATLGYRNSASGYFSFAVGECNNVSGYRSTAFGNTLTNSVNSSTIIGPSDGSAIHICRTGLTTGVVQFCGYGAGTLTTDANGVITASSDENLKDISGNYTSGLANILQVNPISYTWKKGTGLDNVNSYSGFSAQNLQAAIPEAVTMGRNGYLNIQDRPIMAASINAIKELNTLSLASVTSAQTNSEKIDALISLVGTEGVSTSTRSLFDKLDLDIVELAKLTSENSDEIIGLKSQLEIVSEKIGGLVTLVESFGASVVDGVLHFGEVVFRKVKTEELCLDDVCITKEQLQKLLDNANLQAKENVPPPVSGTTTDPVVTGTSTDPIINATSTDETGGGDTPALDPVIEPTPDPVVDPTPEPVVEPVIEAEPEPAPEPATETVPESAPAPSEPAPESAI